MNATIEMTFGMWLIILGLVGFGVWQLIQIEKLLKQMLIKQDNLNISFQKGVGFLEALKIKWDQRGW